MPEEQKPKKKQAAKIIQVAAANWGAAAVLFALDEDGKVHRWLNPGATDTEWELLQPPS